MKININGVKEQTENIVSKYDSKKIADLLDDEKSGSDSSSFDMGADEEKCEDELSSSLGRPVNKVIYD